MASCTNCHSKWSTKDVWKLGFSKYGKQCANCHTKQYVSFKNGGFLMALGYVSGIIGLLLIIFFPFYITLSDRDEAVM